MDSSFNLFPTLVLSCTQFISEEERIKIFGDLKNRNAVSHGAVMGGKSSHALENNIIFSLGLEEKIQQKLNETALPIESIDSLSINPRDDVSLCEKVLGLEFGDRVKVNITNPDSSTFSDEVWIESISHTIDSSNQSWNYQVTLSPAGSSGWVLGQAKIGEGTRFAYT